jgi:hypothetical protein
LQIGTLSELSELSPLCRNFRHFVGTFHPVGNM